MQIAFHIGAHCTDEDRLLKSILKNADTLLHQGVAVPGPGKYRSLIRETIQGLGGATPPPETRNVLLDAIAENDDVDRLVMSNENFICVPNRIFDGAVFYLQAEARARALRQLFPGDEIELFMGIRNPVTFLQETFKRSHATTISGYLGLMHPEELRWSDVIRRIRMGAPDCPLTVWCNEDSPLLWEELIRRISDTTSETELVGGLDMLATIITPDGIRQLTDQLRQSPPATPAVRHEMIAAIWENHAIDAEVVEEIEISELDPALVVEMTESYEDDLVDIAGMEGVTLLMPFS